MKRRLVILVLVAATVAVGCQEVRVGSKCRGGYAKSRGWIVQCTKGRWTKWMTIAEGQAKLDEFLRRFTPRFIEPISTVPPSGTARVGGTWNVEFRVVNIDGRPIPNVEVTFGDSVVPTLWGVPSPTFNGAGARVVGARTVRTNAAGHAGTTIEANGIAGSFELPVTAGSIAHRQSISTSPERPATVSVTSPTAVTVGEGQPVEIFVQARDRYGNVTPDGQLAADWDDYWFDLSAVDRLGTLHRLVLTTLPFEETPEELPSITTTVIVGVGDAAGIAGPASVQVTILNT